MSFVTAVLPNVGRRTIGEATLVAGTVTEAGAFAGHNATARCVYNRRTVGGGTPGILAFSRAGDDLTITSSEATDVPIVNYCIESINP